VQFFFGAKKPKKDIRALLMSGVQRDLDWLKQALQSAVELEFATIPPYLFALWSIASPSLPVIRRIKDVVLEEMLHFGIACNLLNALDGGMPNISGSVPTYPRWGLPGGVHPGLRVRLCALSKTVVADTFMKIEEPECGPIVWYRGESFPTIGAFYTAIQDAFNSVQPNISTPRQVSFNDPSFPNVQLNPIPDVPGAIAALEKVKVQGEGAAGTPVVDPATGELSHYAKFGEIYHGHQLEEIFTGHWAYTGPEVRFPATIHPIAPIPTAGYPESDDFNRVYGSMLANLQSAWATGGTAGGGFVSAAKIDMVQMASLGRDLMQQEITPGGSHFAPTFRPI
jgi:hypothetical protein